MSEQSMIEWVRERLSECDATRDVSYHGIDPEWLSDRRSVYEQVLEELECRAEGPVATLDSIDEQTAVTISNAGIPIELARQLLGTEWGQKQRALFEARMIAGKALSDFRDSQQQAAVDVEREGQ